MLISGCAPTPEPKPTPDGSPSPSVSAPQTEKPAAEPEPAFDVSCVDVAAAMTALLGDSDTPVAPTVSLVSSPSWYPGPGEYMFQPSGGIACSTGSDARGWEVTITPRAAAVIAGATERMGYPGEGAECAGEFCAARIREDDVLVMARVNDPALSHGDAQPLADALQPLADRASRTLRDVDMPDSEIFSLPCERLLAPEELATRVGTEVYLADDFGGWGIPAETYHVVNGADICYYSSGDPYMGEWYLTITSLPGGAWAFEKMSGEPVEIEGADAALAGVDAFGRAVLDLRAGPDWIRLTSDAGNGGLDVAATAEHILGNIGKGVPAPQ